MVRTQIQLTEGQAEALKRLAALQGVSMATLVRVAVDQLLAQEDEERKWQRALSVVGKYHSKEGDIADRHDDYLAEDFMDRDE